MSLPHEPPPAPERAAAPTANGPPSLSDRVRELSLNGRATGTPSRSSSSAWLPWVLCILLAGAWASMGIRWYRTGGSPSPNPAPGGDVSKADAPPSASAPSAGAGNEPKLERDAIVHEAKGYLIPSHSISISPIDVSGRIIDLRIEEGKAFKKGELLAAIDATPFEAEKKEAEAQVAGCRARLNESKASWALEIEQAKGELSEAKAALAEAKLVYDTARATQGGAVARLDLGQASRRYEAAEQRVIVLDVKLRLAEGEARKLRIDALDRDLQAAEARLRRAEWRLGNCRITAPVDGVVLTKRTEYGSLVNPVALNSGSSGGVATGIGDIADLSKLEVDLDIQERDIRKIKPGLVCQVRPDAYPDRVYDGFYDRAMPIAKRANGVIPTRVRVIIPATEKQGEYLRPDMSVSVIFLNREVDRKVREEFERQEAEYRRAGTADFTLTPTKE
jgi:HlyD family secretion protein